MRFREMNNQRLWVWILITRNRPKHLWPEPMMFLDNIKRKRKVFRSNWLSVMEIGVFLRYGRYKFYRRWKSPKIQLHMGIFRCSRSSW
ncbi:MAG: hypothetical protein Ct9H300mP16_15270 [Pseudomonadota bacterium]|nr:MAG: hypothetical protein Ct9H300mP16_15270 [Pseudomonadota bacterium]